MTRHDKIMIALALLLSGLIVLITHAVFANSSSMEVDWKAKHHHEWVQEIIRMESSGGRNLHGKHGEYGVAQFKLDSFQYLKKLAKMEQLDWSDNTDQVTLLSWCLLNGQESHWTTARKAEENVVKNRYILRQDRK